MSAWARCQVPERASKHGGSRRETQSKLGLVRGTDRPVELHKIARYGAISGVADADDAFTGTSAEDSGTSIVLFLTCPLWAKSTGLKHLLSPFHILLTFARPKTYAHPTPWEGTRMDTRTPGTSFFVHWTMTFLLRVRDTIFLTRRGPCTRTE